MSYPTELNSKRELREPLPPIGSGAHPKTVTKTLNGQSPETLIKGIQALTLHDTKISLSKPDEKFHVTIDELTIEVNLLLSIWEKSNIAIAEMSQAIACTIQIIHKKHHRDDHHFTFLASFQICTQLPPAYRNQVWDLLSKEYQGLSFEKSCSLTHALHTLTLFREKPFDYLLSFLNVLSCIQSPHTNGTLPFKTCISLKSTTPTNHCAMLLKTVSRPTAIDVALKTLQEDFHADLMVPCFTTLAPLHINGAFPCLSDEQRAVYESLEQVSKNLLLDSSSCTKRLGCRLLIAIASVKKINAADFEERLLRILPQLDFTSNGSDEDRLIVANIRKAFPALLAEKSFERLIDVATHKESFGWSLDLFPKL
ncbi:MAG: hypothetical protein JSR46_12490, partial [Verrucomicrobia bacterium]|nr:hypothetical protein [Verrucomicrobiota bacterium]